MKRVLFAGVCLWAAGCGFNRNGAAPDQTAGAQPPDTEFASAEPPASGDDPPVENPVRDVTDDLESQRPIASDPEPAPVFVDEPDALIEGLFSAWTDAQLLDLLFPDNRFQRGPEFLDGGPNTLYRLCVQDGTPEFLCWQRYAP